MVLRGKRYELWFLCIFFDAIQGFARPVRTPQCVFTSSKDHVVSERRECSTLVLGHAPLHLNEVLQPVYVFTSSKDHVVSERRECSTLVLGHAPLHLNEVLQPVYVFTSSKDHVVGERRECSTLVLSHAPLHLNEVLQPVYVDVILQILPDRQISYDAYLKNNIFL